MTRVLIGELWVYPLALVFPFTFGAGLGLLGALLMTRWWGTLNSKEVVLAMLLGGVWFTTSALYPSAGFPIVPLRTYLGAIVMGALGQILIAKFRSAP